MGDVVFLDSSVLFNLLDVPDKNGERTAVVADFKRLKDNGATFVFRVTAVIETGNVIAQLADGHARRTCMERFVEWLRRALTATVPMAVPLVEFAMTGIGSGDASLLMETDRFRAKVPSATPIKLWTLDALLASHG